MTYKDYRRNKKPLNHYYILKLYSRLIIFAFYLNISEFSEFPDNYNIDVIVKARISSFHNMIILYYYETSNLRTIISL